MYSFKSVHWDNLDPCNIRSATIIWQSHIRAVAMNSPEGLKRGMEVIDTGHPMTVPVGSFVLGRIFNVLGIPIMNIHEN